MLKKKMFLYLYENSGIILRSILEKASPIIHLQHTEIIGEGTVWPLIPVIWFWEERAPIFYNILQLLLCKHVCVCVCACAVASIKIDTQR